jgi:hypothetical protein
LTRGFRAGGADLAAALTGLAGALATTARDGAFTAFALAGVDLGADF